MATAIVREAHVGGLKTRVYRGWRMDEIEETLDFCARVPGFSLRSETDEKFRDALGRLTRKWRDEKEGRRMWARQNRDVARENSKKQWKVQEQKLRAAYAEYLPRWKERFPGAVPVGFDRWRRVFYKGWVNDPESVMVPNSRMDVDPSDQRLVGENGKLRTGSERAYLRGCEQR